MEEWYIFRVDNDSVCIKVDDWGLGPNKKAAWIAQMHTIYGLRNIKDINILKHLIKNGANAFALSKWY